MNQREQRGGSPKQKIRSYGMKMNATASSAPIFSTTSFVSCVARFLDFAFRVEKTGAPLEEEVHHLLSKEREQGRASKQQESYGT